MSIETNRYDPETDRLNFIINRDGTRAAVEFAHRTMVSYRRHVLYGHIDRLLMRRKYIESYLAFKRFAREQERP